MSDSYLWWRQALKGEFGPIYENDPQPGYYRMRRGKGGPWVPVAIWTVEGSSQLSCLVSGHDRDPYEIWTWCCRYPVTYEAYAAVAERGEAWPEDLPVELHAELERFDRSRPMAVFEPTPVVSASGATALASSSSSAFASSTSGIASFTSAVSASSWSADNSAPAASIGHNSSGVTEAEVFLEEIEIVLRSAEDWIAGLDLISSHVEADKAANYAERFSNLETRAEEARTLEKRPVLDLGKMIDAKWKPVIAKAIQGKICMKKALEPYLIAERDRRISRGGNGNEIEPPRAGTSGRRIGLRSRQIVSVTDQDALIAHYRDDQRIWSDKAIKDLVLKITETDLIAGLSIPGASFIEELTAA